MGFKWSEEEVNFLRANAGTMTSHEIGKHLNRSHSGVSRHASKLDIQILHRYCGSSLGANPGVKLVRVWTKSDVNNLYSFSSYMRVEDIAKRLDRSMASINFKMRSLKIRYFQGKYTMCELARMFGMSNQGIGYRRDKLGLTFRTRKQPRGPTNHEIVMIARDILDNPGQRSHMSSKTIKDIIKEFSNE